VTGPLGDRAAGCLLGLALGDALGAPFEFRRSDAVPAEWPALEVPGVFGPAGATTDDTALARNLVRSLVQHGRLDGADLAARHLDWLRSSPPDIGHLTRMALTRIADGAAPEEAARTAWEDRGPERAASNGSVMYCAPLGAAYAGRPADELLAAADRLSGLTHHDDRCRAACQAVTVAVAAAVRGEDRRAAVPGAIRLVHGAGRTDEAEELAFMVDEAGARRPVDGPDQGYVMYAAGIGLRTLRDAPDFESGLRAVVRLGGDTDTNGAVAGALLGAALGIAGLPADWLSRLADRQGIEAEAIALARLARG
jgi:ADP-ribosyl-[dinitrogen reductase] hydrolase